MKSAALSIVVVFFIGLAGCDTNKESNTERTVLETDTVGVETEYEVEQKVRETTVNVDTVTETQTVTREQDLDSADSN